MSKLTKEQREAWLIEYMAGLYPRESVDVCSREFVEAYTDATGAAHQSTMYGANKCPLLGRDLARLTKSRRLERSRTGISGMAGLGFPRWVWSYRLSRLERMLREDIAALSQGAPNVG